MRFLRNPESHCGLNATAECLNAKTAQVMNPFFQNLALPFLSDLPLLTCYCHGNNFTLFFPLNLHLIFATTVSPPRNSLPCPSKDVLVRYTLCEFSYHNPRPNYFHSVGNVSAVACRPSPDQLFTSRILDGL